MTDTPVGYRRDRSFYESRPSGGHMPKVHREALDRRGMAACDSRSILLETETPLRVTNENRCRRCFPGPLVNAPAEDDESEDA